MARDVSTVEDIKRVKSDLARELKAFPCSGASSRKRIGVEGLNLMPQLIYEIIEKSLSSVSLERPTILTDLRMVKSNWEIRMLDEAGKLNDDGLAGNQTGRQPSSNKH